MPEIVAIQKNNLYDYREANERISALWYILNDTIIMAEDWVLVDKAFTDRAVENAGGMPPSATAALAKPINVGRSDVNGSSIAIEQNEYYDKLSAAEAAADYRIGKHVAGVNSTLGSPEAVDATGFEQTKLSCSGTAIKGYRGSTEPPSTPQLNVTDSSHTSGRYGWAATATTYAATADINDYVFGGLQRAHLLPATSSTLNPIAFFEMPIIGRGTNAEPFRARMPKGKLAVNHSSVIKSLMNNGKPREYKAIVRVFDNGKVTSKKLDAIRAIPGARELDSDFAAIKAAMKLDDLLNPWDFTDYKKEKMGAEQRMKLKQDYLKWMMNERKVLETEHNADHFLFDCEKGWRNRHA